MGKGKKDKKKGKKGSRGKKKSTRSRVSKGPGLGTEVGGLVTLYKILTDKTTTGASPVDAAKVAGRPWTDRITDMATRAGKNAQNLENLKWVVAGVGVHWGKNKPVLKIVGRPLDQLVKKYFHRSL